MLAPKSPDEMTTDATITDAARDHIRSYFAEFGTAGEEFERFVIEQLDHLEASSQDRGSNSPVGPRPRGVAPPARQLANSTAAPGCRYRRGRKLGRPVLRAAGRASPSRPNRLCPSMPRNSPRPCPSSRKSEPCSASRSQAARPAQAQWQSISQTAVAELAQARAELAASSEDLRAERRRFAEAAAPLVEAISRQPAPVEQPVPAAVAPEPKPSDTQLPLPAAARANRRRALAEPAVETVPEPAAEPAGWWDELQQLRRRPLEVLAASGQDWRQAAGRKGRHEKGAQCAHVRGTGRRQYPQPIPRPAGRARQSPGEATDDQITSARGQQARIMVASPEQPVTASTAVTPVDAATKATRPRTSGRRETDRGDERLAMGAHRAGPRSGRATGHPRRCRIRGDRRPQRGPRRIEIALARDQGQARPDTGRGIARAIRAVRVTRVARL